jgi:uncharacterized protein
MRKLALWATAAAAVSFGATMIAAPGGASLVDAAESGDRATVLRLLAEKGSNPNTPSLDGTTAIMWAAHNDDLALVQALIKAGANVKLRNQFGTTAITEASIIGSAAIIDALLKAGADPNTKNPEGETPLMAVSRSGKIDAAKRLLDAGADVNAKETWGGQSAIMWAAAQSQPEMVKLLASRGADLNAHGMIRQWERKVITEPRPKDMNKGGFTPLIYAAREGCVECAKALIEAKADPDLQDPDGVTALNMALLNQHYSVASYLIKAGADLDKWDLFGRSPVYMAADVNTLPVMGNGATVTIPSEDALSALDVARQLLEAGANPNIQLKRRPPYRNVPQDRGGDGILAQGATPLLRASRAGDAKFVDLLLKHHALVDLPSKEGVTPLMAAAGVEFGARVTRGRNRTDEGVLATMKLLIAAGANVNARSLTEPRGAFGGRGGGPGAAAGGGATPDGASARAQAAVGAGRRGSQMPSASAVPNQTALHGAAERGFDKFIEFLVANGADLTTKDANGRTPLDLAKGVTGNGRGSAESFPKTVALLESLMAAKGIPVTK